MSKGSRKSHQWYNGALYNFQRQLIGLLLMSETLIFGLFLRGFISFLLIKLMDIVAAFLYIYVCDFCVLDGI